MTLAGEKKAYQFKQNEKNKGIAMDKNKKFGEFDLSNSLTMAVRFDDNL